MKFAIGITTAPRVQPALVRCVASTRANGWRPVVSAEPGSNLTGCDGLEIVLHPHRRGAWHNWRFLASHLLLTTDADVIVMLQDDALLCRGMEPLLRRDLWPCAQPGWVSLYAPGHYGEAVSRAAFRDGLTPIAANYLWGAVALVFRRDLLQRILECRTAQHWHGVNPPFRPSDRAPEDIANIDRCVDDCCRRLRLERWSYIPSLVEHIGDASTVGHAPGRHAHGFVGEDCDISAERPEWPIGTRWGSDGEREA